MYRYKLIPVNIGFQTRYALVMEHVFNGVTIVDTFNSVEEARIYYEEALDTSYYNA